MTKSEDRVVGPEELEKMIQRGEISMNPARPRPHRGEAALITRDVNGRLCVGAIGRPHLLRQHLNGSKGKETEDMNEVEDIKRRAGITEQTDDPSYYTKLADVYTRFIMGDSDQALRQMQELHRAESAPSKRRMKKLGMGFGNLKPVEYNRLYSQVYKMMLNVIQMAQSQSDTASY